MFGWKKRLGRELDEIVRDMPSEFAPENKNTEKAAPRKTSVFRIAAAATTCALLLSIVLPVFIYLLPSQRNTGGIILMEINPAVRIYTDENDRVSTVRSENGDGDLLLADTEFTRSLEGAPAEEAARAIAARAHAMGFIDEGQSAVRLTVAADTEDSAEELQQKTETSVAEYFCGKGVFVPVLGRTAELSLFGEEDTAREQAEAASGLPVTVAEREAAATETGKIEESFRSSFYGYVEEITDYVLRTVTAKKEILHEIEAMNDEIEEHPDNPKPLGVPLSYWSVKDYPYYTPTAEFAALIKQTDEKVAAFAEKFGQSLRGSEGYFLFLALNTFYGSVDLEELKDWTDALLSLVETFTGIFDPSTYIGFLSGDDLLESTLTALFDGLERVPETAESYVASVAEMARREGELALYEHGAEAEKQGQVISQTDYAAKMQALAEKFENFEDFWNSFQ